MGVVLPGESDAACLNDQSAEPEFSEFRPHRLGEPSWCLHGRVNGRFVDSAGQEVVREFV